jgi:hypothetical protein
LPFNFEGRPLPGFLALSKDLLALEIFIQELIELR